MARRPGRPVEVQPVLEQVGDDRVIATTVLTGADGRRRERFQVITYRDGKIVDLQGCVSLRAARRFARSA